MAARLPHLDAGRGKHVIRIYLGNMCHHILLIDILRADITHTRSPGGTQHSHIEWGSDPQGVQKMSKLGRWF